MSNSDATDRRMALARELTTVYASRSEVLAMACVGSAATGRADSWSDPDLHVYWEKLDLEWLDAVPLEDCGAQRFTYHKSANGHCVEQYFFQGLKVDVANCLWSVQEEIVSRVLGKLETDVSLMANLSSVAKCIPLYGEEKILALKEEMKTYPEALQRKVVGENLRFFPTDLLLLCLERRDLFGFTDYVLRNLKSCIAVLCGLNRLYYSGEGEQKGTLAILEYMALKPTNAEERIRTILERQSEQTAKALHDLISDVLDLVDQHRSDVSTERPRYILNFEFPHE